MTDTSLWEGRTAVISGGGSGIGEALARHAALELGMVAVVVDVAEERVRAAAERIVADGGAAHAMVVDVADGSATQSAGATIVRRWGAPALVGCNAGVEHTGRVWEMSPAQWARVQHVNVDGAFHLAQSLLPAMIDDGRPAHVVFTSSVGGISIGAQQSAYLVSKHAVRVLGQCLRADLDEAGAPVGVSILLPGAVRTRIFDDAVASSSAADDYRRSLAQMLADDGLDPGAVAAATFMAIDQDALWIYPDPDAARPLLDHHLAALREGLPDVS